MASRISSFYNLLNTEKKNLEMYSENSSSYVKQSRFIQDLENSLNEPLLVYAYRGWGLLDIYAKIYTFSIYSHVALVKGNIRIELCPYGHSIRILNDISLGYKGCLVDIYKIQKGLVSSDKQNVMYNFVIGQAGCKYDYSVCVNKKYEHYIDFTGLNSGLLVYGLFRMFDIFDSKIGRRVSKISAKEITKVNYLEFDKTINI